MPQIQHPRSLRLATAGLCALLSVGVAWGGAPLASALVASGGAAQAQPAADGWIVWETDRYQNTDSYTGRHTYTNSC